MMRRRFAWAGLLACALWSCGGGGQGSDGGSKDCDFELTLDSATCSFYDNPDPFFSDSWFVDVSGTAKGPTSTELSINDDANAVTTTTTCADWSGNASHTCVSQSGEPGTTTWTSKVEVLEPSDTATSKTVKVTAKLRQVLVSPACQNEVEKETTVTCGK
jgi:hypothetical protein